MLTSPKASVPDQIAPREERPDSLSSESLGGVSSRSRGMRPALLAHLVEAAAQRGRERRRRRAARQRCELRRAAARLRCDQRLHSLAVLVVELLGVELALERGDELL